MCRWMSFIKCAGFVCAALSCPILAAEREAVEILVHPSACQSPCTVRVTIHTPPDPTLRALAVEMDSPVFFRSSLIALDGADSPRAHVIEYRSLPPGRYEVRAVLTRGQQDRIIDRVALHVTGVGT